MHIIDLTRHGKVYDLTEDLGSELAKIKVGDKEYEINTGFKTVMELDKLFKDGSEDILFVKKFLETSLGGAAANELIELNKDMKFYKKIINIIADEMKGVDEEESGSAS